MGSYKPHPLIISSQERRRTQVALHRKADLVYRRFNAVPGVSCRRVRGAMYAFPKIELSPRAIEEAKVFSLPPPFPSSLPPLPPSLHPYSLSPPLYRSEGCLQTSTTVCSFSNRRECVWFLAVASVRKKALGISGSHINPVL